MKPRFHVFGHIHEAHGVRFEDDIVFINAAMLGRSRLPTHIPIVFDYER
jgi:Icc-related predicted phosphoesterase